MKTNRQLQQLHEASERISASLVELELDSGRQLLEASALEGESAACWSAANDALTELWRCHGLLEGVLKQADRVRDADQLRALLDGPSIELATGTVPLAERTLLGSPRHAQRCSPHELIERMSASFEQVKSVVSRFGAVWNECTPRLESAGRLLEQSRSLAADLKGSPSLDTAAQRMASLRSRLAADPLSVRPADLDDLVRELMATQQELAATAELRRGFETRILQARELLERLRSAVRDARAAHDELLVKISAPSTPAPPAPPDGLDARLSEITALGRHADWAAARLALERWTSDAGAQLDTARQALSASRAPIEARNQFRALLEAYQVKAGRLGLIEDPRLAEIFERAQQALYTAPTDLALVAQLVRSYQQALGSSPQIGEVMT